MKIGSLNVNEVSYDNTAMA